MSEVILNFHGIGMPHPGVDTSEARYWLSPERFDLALDRAAAARAQGRMVGLTFDDGNASDLEIALPRLVARGLTGAFFVLTGRIGMAHYLDADGIRALRDAGMAIGLHGRDHVDWRRLDAAGLTRETVTARAELARIIGAPVDTVAIPFGAYNRKVISWLTGQRFATIYTSDGGTSGRSRRIRPRTSLTSTIDAAGIDAVLTDRVSFLKRTKRRCSAALRQNLI